MPYRRTKQERQAWWRSLSQEEKAAYVSRREKKPAPGRAPSTIPTRGPLTPEEMQAINDTMRRLGLEKQIVLPDMPTEPEIPDYILHLIDTA